MAHRRAPPRRRGARRRVKGRRAHLLQEEGPVGRQARRRAGQERSCPGAKGLAGNNRRVVLPEPTTCRAFTTSSSQCS